MKLYTKFGDRGETALFDGTRVWKDDPRVAAYGTVDELNALLGWCGATARETIAERIAAIQSELFVIGAQLATPPAPSTRSGIGSIGPREIERLERWIDESSEQVPELKHFVLPGGCELAARLHVARTCCRRAERCVVPVQRESPPLLDVIVYLNRLSDLLFAWSRQANHQAGCPEVQWTPGPATMQNPTSPDQPQS